MITSWTEVDIGDLVEHHRLGWYLVTNIETSKSKIYVYGLFIQRLHPALIKEAWIRECFIGPNITVVRGGEVLFRRGEE